MEARLVANGFPKENQKLSYMLEHKSEVGTFQWCFKQMDTKNAGYKERIFQGKLIK